MSITMRQTFADTMLHIGKKDPNLVVLIGDISHFILQPFAKACPGRFYNIGICEQTIMNMAAGLSKVGLHPVVHTIAPFLVERSFEQIKLDFGYQKLGVTIITVGSAFDYTALGCTHHCYNDFALLRHVDGMQMVYPASPTEFETLFAQTYNNGLPTYIRLPEAQHGVKFSKGAIRLGKGMVVRRGTNLTIVAIGPQLQTSLDAVPGLIKEGYNPEILYFHTVKPLDTNLIAKSLTKTKRCLVIEEHASCGGVYDDVLRSCKHIPRVLYASLNAGDHYIHEYGTYKDICTMLGFTKEGVVKKVIQELS